MLGSSSNAGPGSGLRSNSNSMKMLMGEKSSFMLLSGDTCFSLLLPYLLSVCISPGASGESETGGDVLLIL